jgi:hypothetical protein
MVITLLFLLKYSAGQWNTLVNFGAALSPLGGQFSVGVNTLTPFEVSPRTVNVPRWARFALGNCF